MICELLYFSWNAKRQQTCTSQCFKMTKNVSFKFSLCQKLELHIPSVPKGNSLKENTANYILLICKKNSSN